jgi:hypothetical protein
MIFDKSSECQQGKIGFSTYSARVIGFPYVKKKKEKKLDPLFNHTINLA